MLKNKQMPMNKRMLIHERMITKKRMLTNKRMPTNKHSIRINDMKGIKGKACDHLLILQNDSTIIHSKIEQ